MLVDDFKDENGLWVKSKGVWPNNLETKACALWRSLKYRCKINGAFQTKNQTYVGCYTSEYFKNFQFFANWCQTQVGYTLNNYQLDKDILFFKNKFYSENTCVFVPQPLNTFFTDSAAKRGQYLIGCCWNKRKQKFTSQIGGNSTSKYLGYFHTELEAHKAWVTAKETESFRWYERLRDGEFIVDPRVIERLRTWRYEQ